MTTEELLVPRYLIINDYPNNTFGKIGDIITPQSFESEDNFYDWKLNEYPHLFHELNWIEHRNPNELPDYIEHEDLIYEVFSWREDRVIVQDWCFYYKVDDILPSTKEEFDKQN